MAIIDATTLFWVFAKSEEEQSLYFPIYDHPVFADPGMAELETTSARLIALCELAYQSRHEAVSRGEFGRICSDVSSLATLMIESSGIYDWLVIHPKLLQGPEGVRVDPSIYGVWSVMRRLCAEGLRFSPIAARPHPFKELFSSVIREV